jgi:hypothetical protein
MFVHLPPGYEGEPGGFYKLVICPAGSSPFERFCLVFCSLG